MSAQHTPGPWHVDLYDATGVDDVDGYRIAITGFGEDDTDQANARLIAAAPDMLAALRELVRKADFGEPVPDWLNVWDEARAAIAKATESPGASNLKG